MRDEAGHTSRYVVASAEQLQALQDECSRLRQQLDELTRAHEQLRLEHQQLKAERDGIWALYAELTRELYRRHPEDGEKLEAELAAAIAEAERNPGDVQELIRELERTPEPKKVG